MFSVVFAILFLATVVFPFTAPAQVNSSAGQGGSQTYNVTVPANQPWTDTGISLTAGEQVTITATGTTNNGSIYSNAVNGPDGQGVVSADGYSSTAVVHNPQSVPFLATSLPTWSLIGYIGTSPPPSTGPIKPPVVFEVGSSDSFTVTTPGEFYLGFNDNTFNGDTGQYQAVITVSAPASYSYTGVWQGQTVNLNLVTNVTVEQLPDAKLAGQITDFQTNEPTGSKPPYYELNGEGINVWTAPAEFPGVYVVHNGDQGTQPTYGTWTFTVSSPSPGPVLSGMSPASGPPGTTVTFTGSGLGQEAGSVTFTNQTSNVATSAVVASWSETKIVCSIPANLQPGMYSPSLTIASGQPVGPGTMASWPLFQVTSAVSAPVSMPSTVVFSINSNKYTSDGQTATMDVAPFIRQGRTYLPVRYMGYAIGMSKSDIQWDPQSETATFSYAGRTVSFTFGVNSYIVDGSTHTMDVAPIIVDGRMCIPARYFGDAFAYTVGWSGAAQQVTLTKVRKTSNANFSTEGNSASSSGSTSGTGTASYTFENRPPGEPFTKESAAELMANTSYPNPSVTASATSFTVAFYGNESDFRSTRNGGPPPPTYQPMIYGNPWIWGWRVVWSTNQNDLDDALYNVDSPLYVYTKNTSSPGSGQINSDTWYTDIEATYSPDPQGNIINGNDPGLQGITITDAPGVEGSSIQPDTTYYFGIVRILANLAPNTSINNPLNAMGYPSWYLNHTIPSSAGGPSGPDWAAVPSPGSVCGWTIQYGSPVYGEATTASSNASGPTGGRWGHII
ncbi:MAG: stalk domain-containing protein [Peptococcaceae bacterium]|nr:stalk domain-containing protein [Peptococcaceae bacterium]